MITLRLDKNGGINKGDVQAFEHDNLSEVYIIQLYKNGAIYDLTNKSIELTMVERKRKIGDMVTLPIYNATEGKIKLEVVSDITKQDGIFDFKLTVKDTTGLIETFPNFQVKIKNDITDSITGEIIQDPNFTILTDGLKALADYNIYKTNALKVPEIEQDIVEINEQLDTIENKKIGFLYENMLKFAFGAKGDGITDDTNAINNAIRYLDSLGGGDLIFPSGTYLIKAHDDNNDGDSVHKNIEFTGGLKVSSNIKFKGIGNVKLKAITNNKQCYNIMRVLNCKNVEIDNITFEGDKDNHNGTSGEWGHGLTVFHSENIKIANCNFNKLWGDGVYLGILYGNNYETQNNNIDIVNCKINEVSRNGISICSVNNLNVIDCDIKNVLRVSPRACIDIEPEGTCVEGGVSPSLKNINIVGLKTELSSCGIAFFPNKTVKEIRNINVINHVNNLSAFGMFFYGLDEEEIKGVITVKDFKSYDNPNGGVAFQNYPSIYPRVEFYNPYIQNSNYHKADYTDNLKGWVSGGCFTISRYYDADKTKPIGNVYIENLCAIDTREEVKNVVGFCCGDDKGIGIEKVEIKNIVKLDEQLQRMKRNVRIISDENNILTYNRGYYSCDITGDNIYTLIKSSGVTSGSKRYVTFNDKVVENTKIKILHDSSINNNVVIDLDKYSPRLKLHPFENTGRYIIGQTQGSSMIVEKIDGELYASEIIGKWVNTDSLNPSIT